MKQLCLIFLLSLISTQGLTQTSSALSVHQEVQQIFDRLVMASGNHKLAHPRLEITGDQYFVAYLDRREAFAIVGLEENALTLCRSFGDRYADAVACLLAHELIHYYYGHGSAEQDFIIRYVNADNQLAYHLSEYEEIEADALGMFLAFAAGYNPRGMVPQLLDKIYQGYALPDSLPGYPSLSTRKAIAEQGEQKADALHRVFETGIHLNVMRYYQEAAICYEYILQTFESREIYNNAGLNLVMEVLTHRPPQEDSYRYPLEIDRKSRLSSGGRRMSVAEQQQLLNRARKHFEFAIRMDSAYVPAYVNLACVYDLMEGDQIPGQTFKALAASQEAMFYAKRTQDPMQLGAAHLISGILVLQQGDSSRADRHFESALRSKDPFVSSIAQHNLNTLRMLPIPPQMETAIGPSYFQEERVQGIALSDMRLPNNPQAFTRLTPKESFPRLSLSGFDTLESRLLLLKTETLMGPRLNTRHLLFLDTPEAYEGQSQRGVQVGYSLSDVEQRYGNRYQRVELPGATYLIYWNAKLIFQLNAAGNVEAWTVFQLR